MQRLLWKVTNHALNPRTLPIYSQKRFAYNLYTDTSHKHIHMFLNKIFTHIGSHRPITCNFATMIFTCLHTWYAGVLAHPTIHVYDILWQHTHMDKEWSHDFFTINFCLQFSHAILQRIYAHIFLQQTSAGYIHIKVPIGGQGRPKFQNESPKTHFRARGKIWERNSPGKAGTFIQMEIMA